MRIKKNLAISESGFVFDPTTGDSFSLNAVGLEILQLIREGKSMSDIVDFMTSKYDVEPGVFERYYYDFTGMLKQFQLVEGNGEN